MFKALHLTTPIKEDDIEVAKKKLKDVLGFTEAENNFDDVCSDTDDEEHNPDGKEFYVVEKVLDRAFENGVQKFKVKWEGYENITWEPFDNFVSRGSKMAIYLFYLKRWEKKLEKKAAANQEAEIGRASNIMKEKKDSQSKDGPTLVVSDEFQVDVKPGSSKVRALNTKSKQKELKNEVQAVHNAFGKTFVDGKICQSSRSYIKEKQQKMERQKKIETLEKQMKEQRLRRKEEKDRERRMKQLKKDLGSSDEDE